MIEPESVMTVFAGTNGAGKSTISLQMRDYVGTIIDPDQIAKRINPEDPRSADLSAGREAVKKIRELIGRKENFAIETTLSGSFVLRHMKTAKEQGYKVVMYYIGLQDVQMHIDRVASRVEQGGHWIAEEDIRWRYGQSLSNLSPLWRFQMKSPLSTTPVNLRLWRRSNVHRLAFAEKRFLRGLGGLWSCTCIKLLQVRAN